MFKKFILLAVSAFLLFSIKITHAQGAPQGNTVCQSCLPSNNNYVQNIVTGTVATAIYNRDNANPQVFGASFSNIGYSETGGVMTPLTSSNTTSDTDNEIVYYYNGGGGYTLPPSNFGMTEPSSFPYTEVGGGWGQYSSNFYAPAPSTSCVVGLMTGHGHRGTELAQVVTNDRIISVANFTDYDYQQQTEPFIIVDAAHSQFLVGYFVNFGSSGTYDKVIPMLPGEIVTHLYWAGPYWNADGYSYLVSS